MRIIALLLLMVSASCVAAGKQIRQPMSEGERIYRAQCSRCHRLYFPEQYDFETLERYVNKYGQGIISEDRQFLINYLKEASKEQE